MDRASVVHLSSRHPYSTAIADSRAAVIATDEGIGKNRRDRKLGRI
jgi:hypothetical protein